MSLQEIFDMDGPLPSDLTHQWEHFFSAPRVHVNGHSVDPHLFACDLFPLQRMRELSMMVRLAATIQPKTLMSIGCDKGGELYHWCEFVPSLERVVACEIRGTPYGDLFEKRFPHLQFKWLAESSYDHSTYEKVCEFLQLAPIDVLFIDGDKWEFMRDFSTYRELMNNQGLVFMHDIHDKAPGETWQKIIEQGYRTLEIYDTSEAYDLVSRNAEPKNSYEAWLKLWAGRSCGVGCIFLSYPVTNPR